MRSLLMKALFLDIDGVLNQMEIIGSQEIPLRSEKVDLLNKIVEETGCRIVISSSWRIGKSVLQLRRSFSEQGFEYSKKIIGKTPQTVDSNRVHEIEVWLDSRDDIDEFAVVDDRKLSIRNFFRTDSRKGITPNLSKRIIDHLNDE